MTTLLDSLFKGPPLEATLFPPGSRYYGIQVATITLSDGQVVRYLRRRFLPQPDSSPATPVHRVADADRLDNLAAQRLGDPLASWRIADTNAAMRPEELIETGRVLKVGPAAAAARSGND